MADCVVLTKSRKLACMSKQAGVKAIGIAPYDALNLVTKGSTGVTTLPSIYDAGSIARLELKNTTTKFLENGISGGDNRSTGVTGNISCIFNIPENGEVETTKMVEEIMKGEFVMFIEYKNGKIAVAGSQNGAVVTTADGDSGATIGDLVGYTVNIQTMEPDYVKGYVLSGDALTSYATALMAY